LGDAIQANGLTSDAAGQFEQHLGIRNPVFRQDAQRGMPVEKELEARGIPEEVERSPCVTAYNGAVRITMLEDAGGSQEVNAWEELDRY